MTNKEKEIARRLSKLDALEAGGVDNWEWYGASLEQWFKENQHEENCQQVFDELCSLLCEGAYEPSERGAGIAFNDKSMEVAFEFLKKNVKEFN